MKIRLLGLLITSAAMLVSVPVGNGAPDPFLPTSPMQFHRSEHTATQLQDGRVLIAGGSIGGGEIGELYDYSSGTWSSTNPMLAERGRPGAALLPDGRVLVAGGYNVKTGGSETLKSAELFDPATNSWSLTGEMTERRNSVRAVTLLDGRVLVAGGFNSGPDGTIGPLASAEIYDPATGVWTLVGSMSDPREGHEMILLADGRVLAAGGADGSGRLSSAEVYDPASEAWTPVEPMSAPRGRHALAPLPNGSVLAAGGSDGSQILASAEVFDPVSGTWTPIQTMRTPLTDAAVTLGDGVIHLVGGFTTSNAPDRQTIRFDPASGNWLPGCPLVSPRAGATATFLPDGTILVVGSYPSGQDTSTIDAERTYLDADGDCLPDPDTDGDGCPDVLEVFVSPPRDPNDPWDFADVPAPALPAAGDRDQLVTLQDVLAALDWVGAQEGGPPSGSGRVYEDDANANGVRDGQEYDRTPTLIPGISGPPNGAVSISDVLVVLAQAGAKCGFG